MIVGMMKLCFGYVRVSGDAQIEGDGPVRQENAIREYAAQNGFTVVRIFFEDGISGCVETLDRPMYKQMMTECANTGIKTIVIERLDRLSRDVLIQETAIRRQFQRSSLELLSTCEPDLMSKDPSRVFIRVVLGAAAEMDRAHITLKLSAAKARIRATGVRCEGQKPYSDTVNGKSALARIAQLRADGLGFDKIAHVLNAECIPTKRTGTKWHGFTVNKMFQNAA